MKITVVIPFCKADQDRAKKLIEWIGELGGCKDHALLEIMACDADPPKITIKRLGEIFSSGLIIKPSFALPNEAHPRGPNWMFETACKWIQANSKDPWLWLEPDAVPMREGWLQMIEAEYELALKYKKKILAHVTELNDPKYPKKIACGVAVYPPDAWNYYRGLSLNRNVAFDIQFADKVMPIVHQARTLADLVNRKNPPTFSGPNALKVEGIPSYVALWHQCKDDSLINALRARLKKGESKTTEPQKPPLYSISVLAYNNLEYTKDCIESIKAYSGNDWELIFTDNGSNDGTAEYLEALKKELGNRLTVVSNPENIGFIKPNNHALTLAKGKFFVCLNNDMIVSKFWLSHLSKPFSDPKMAITGISEACGSLDENGHGMSGEALEYIEGSCLMVRADLVREHGLFAPYLEFAYCEDCDLSLRMRSLGYKIATVDIPMKHDIQRSKTSAMVIKEGKIPLLEYSKINHKELVNRWGTYLKRRTFQKHITIRRTGAHGDVLFATPIIKAIKEKYPNDAIYVETQCPEMIPKSLASTERNGSPDTLFDLDLAYEKFPKMHVIDAYSKACGLENVEKKLIFEGDYNVAKSETPLCVIHCGPTEWKGRNWEKKKFETVAKLLTQTGWEVITVGLDNNWTMTVGKDLTGKTTIAELYSVIASAHLFIGIDSLPMNLAQAADIPLIGLFGSINPAYRLLGRPWQIGVHADPKEVPCVFGHHEITPPVTFSKCGGECMKAITVEQVIAAIPKALIAKGLPPCQR